MALIEAAIAGRALRIGSGAEQGDDLCYSADSAGAFIAALDSVPCPESFRAYNISAGQLITLQQMIAVLRDLYPGWQGEAGPGLDYRGLGAGYYFVMDISKAREELGFRPEFPFREAVAHYASTLSLLST